MKKNHTTSPHTKSRNLSTNEITQPVNQKTLQELQNAALRTSHRLTVVTVVTEVTVGTEVTVVTVATVVTVVTVMTVVTVVTKQLCKLKN